MTSSTTTSLFLSPLQISALLGIVDVLIPSIPSKSNDDADLNTFWQCDLTQDVDFRKALLNAIDKRLDPVKRSEISFLLNLLSSPMGSWLFFFPYAGLVPPFASSYLSFAEWSREKRQVALKSLQQSHLWQKRMVFNGLKRLIAGIALTFVPESTNGNSEDLRKNPFWAAMGYSGPYHWGITSELDEQMIQNDTASADISLKKEAFINFPPLLELEFDCIVIGSGCGGSVTASTLSQAGYSVLVIEKGSYISRRNTSQLEGDSYDKMYENHALQTTSDGNIMIFAGSTLGGGSAINYACCIELPKIVRLEWSDKFGLKHCHPDSDEFNSSEEAVLRRIGATWTQQIHHNGVNTKIIEGSKALQHQWSETKHNLRDSKHDSAGYTCFGDRYGNKQGMTETFLRDAVKSGCKILENTYVERILYDDVPHDINDIHRAGAKKATAVLVRLNGQLLTIKASRCVICAAGALNTPCLLTRSGFRNPHIGKHLHLHPVTAAYGRYREDIKGWLGAPMTSCNNEFVSGPNGDGYGARIECPPLHPGVSAAASQWHDSYQFKETLLSARNLALAIALQRDIGEGRVKQGNGDTVTVDYELHSSDMQSIAAALKGLIKVLIASGAERVSTMHNDDNGFICENISCASNNKLNPHERVAQQEVQNYLHLVEKQHLRMQKHKGLIISAHQMGTCRFGTSSAQSACDENGELWECDNLFVADTSLFPTASGSNPMVTTLTISHMLSRRLVQRLKYEDSNSENAVMENQFQLELIKSRWQRRITESSKLYLYPFTPVLLSGVIAATLVVVCRWCIQSYARSFSL